MPLVCGLYGAGRKADKARAAENAARARCLAGYLPALRLRLSPLAGPRGSPMG